MSKTKFIETVIGNAVTHLKQQKKSTFRYRPICNVL